MWSFVPKVPEDIENGSNKEERKGGKEEKTQIWRKTKKRLQKQKRLERDKNRIVKTKKGRRQGKKERGDRADIQRRDPN